MKEDLTTWSTRKLIAFADKHWCGGIPTWGQGARLKRVFKELKRRGKI